MIRLRRGEVPDVPWQSLMIPNTHLSVSTAGRWVSTSGHWRGVRSCEWLQMMLPHMTTKTLKAYLLAKLIAFPVPISQLPVVWTNSWGTSVCDAASLVKESQRWTWEPENVLLQSTGVLSKTNFAAHLSAREIMSMFPDLIQVPIETQWKAKLTVQKLLQIFHLPCQW